MNRFGGGAEGPAASSSQPVARLVLLGASNLTRALPTVVGLAEQGLGQPLQVLAALGHGRSYGAWSRCLLRELPGIRECGIWRTLESQPAMPTAALVTDIGNDLIYGFAPHLIARWVEETLDRLAKIGAQTVITTLPICNLEKLSERRYHLMLSVLYPRCKISLATMRDRAYALNDLVREAAARRCLESIEPQPSWYGIDPVHIRTRERRGAWGHVLQSLSAAKSQFSSANPAISQRLRIFPLRAEQMRICGIQLLTPQPRLRVRSGTTIALY